MMFGVIPKLTGYRYGLRCLRVDKIPVASRLAAVYDPSPLQRGDQIPDFGRHQLIPVPFVA